MKLKVLGLNYTGHDCSAAITVNGKLISCCEQERHDYIKHSRNFPTQAINECLKIANLKIDDIDIISLGFLPKLIIKERYIGLAKKYPSRKKFLKLDINRINELKNLEKIIRINTNFSGKIEFNNHHLCHLFSAYFPSGFADSIVASYDGMGEIDTAQFAIVKNKKFKLIRSNNKFPNSLGLIYSAITDYLGWKHHCDEGIIMGLASFGDPNKKVSSKINKSYLSIFRDIIKISQKNPLDIIINPIWIDYQNNYNTWVSKRFIKTFGKKRIYKNKLTKSHKNLAAALQKRLEEVVIYQLKYLKKKFKINKLCIAGGVGLNCSLNGKIVESKIFDEIFVQPASGDSGISYGSCLVSTLKRKSVKILKNLNFNLGHKENTNEIIKNLKKSKLRFKKYKNIYKKVSDLIYDGKIIGWFQDGSEFGPRALGNRSILCKPYPSKMRDYINKKVKFREEFRPFAPAVLKEHQSSYFDLNQDSHHMLIACKAKHKKKKEIGATVHVDNTCRVQTVDKKVNIKFWKLINEFYKKTNTPVLLNTSFNIKGLPIVNNSLDAINCFKKYKIDFLVLHNFLISKN